MIHAAACPRCNLSLTASTAGWNCASCGYSTSALSWTETSLPKPPTFAQGLPAGKKPTPKPLELFRFTAIGERYHVTGRGDAIPVRPLQPTREDLLMGATVEIDGKPYEVRGIEAFAVGSHPRTWTEVNRIGLLIQEKPCPLCGETDDDACYCRYDAEPREEST